MLRVGFTGATVTVTLEVIVKVAEPVWVPSATEVAVTETIEGASGKTWGAVYVAWVASVATTVPTFASPPRVPLTAQPVTPWPEVSF